MTMSEGDVQGKRVRKNRNKKKAKQVAKPEAVVMEEPPPPVEETAPQQTNKKGRKRKRVEKMGGGASVSKSDNIASSNDSIEEKDGQPKKGEVMDEEMTDASLSDKKKWRKKRHVKKDTSDVVDTLDKMDTAKTSEEGNTGNLEVKPSPKRKGKNKQKKKKKKEGEGGGSTPQSDSQRPCLRYLQLWDKERDSWHFQKVRQVWLLQNMYDKVKVPKSDFHVLLRYLENLRGKAREITVKQAEGLIEKLEDKIQDLDKEGKSSDGEEEEDAEEVKKMKVQWRRATDILQTLS